MADGKSRTPKEPPPCPGPSQGCPSRVLALLFRREIRHQESLGPAGITFQTDKVCCLRLGHIMGCNGKAVVDHTELIMGYLGEEPKVKQRRCLADLGRDKSGKMEV